MSELSSAIFRRRSERKYTDQAVDTSVLNRILAAGMQAPSAVDHRPWDFLVLTQPEKKEIIAKMNPYAGMAANAAAVILALGNTDREPEAPWLCLGMAACCQNMLLQCEEEGLGAVWLGVYGNQTVMDSIREKLCLPANIVPFAAISLGYPAKKHPPVDRFDAARIHFENW